MKYDILIIGAGASGLAAAYHAIMNKPQLNILVLEKESMTGRKLNASGNGKCNLTNSDFSLDCYHSQNPEFMEQWTGKHSHEEILAFFEDMGILLYEKNGYYYPVSNQAKQISNLLYTKSRDAGVTYVFQTRVNAIIPFHKQNDIYYKVKAIQTNTDKKNSSKSDAATKSSTVRAQKVKSPAAEENQKEICYEAKHLIIATGGCAAAKLGGCKDGYLLAKQLELRCNPIYPVLSPIYVDDGLLFLAKGVRMDGAVTLKLPDGRVIKESGQIQFNDNNLSGIVMMNLSCYLNIDKETTNLSVLHIDVLPQYSWAHLWSFFETQTEKFPLETLDTMLKGLLPENFVTYLTKRLGMDKSMKLSSLTKKQRNRLTSTLKKLQYSPVCFDDYDKAQVTGGGIAVQEIDVDSFECKQYRNLYITGEVLDVNGKCGGYNLTFAMLSGIQAVEDIIRKY